MNNMRKLFSVITVTVLLIIITYSCSPSSSNTNDFDNTTVIEVPFKKMQRTDKIDRLSLFDSIRVVYLDCEKDENIIGPINDIRIVDDHIFISDEKCVHIFDMNGKNQITINRHGRGHGEYLTLRKFDVNPRSKIIHIFDSTQRKIIKYTYDGTYVGEIMLEERLFRDFAILPNGDYLFYSANYQEGARRGLWQTDSNTVLVKHLIYIDDSFKYGTIKSNSLVHINDSVVGLMGGEDNNLFYHITQDTIIKCYRMVCDLNIPKKIQRSEVFKENQKTKLYGKEDFVETEKILSFCVTNYSGLDIQIVYDKTKNKVYRIYDYTDYDDDINMFRNKNLPPTLPNFELCDNNYIIGFFSVDDILSSTSLKSIFPMITSQSNPVLYIFH